MPDKPVKELTNKHKRFVRNTIAGMSSAMAASRAGYAPSYGKNLLQQPAVRTELALQMQKAGITETLLAKKLREGLNAQTPPKREGGQQYEDQFVRKQFLDVIFKLRGDYSSIKTEHTEKRITILMDSNMVKSLRDSRAITAEEGDILEAEVINDRDAGETEGPKLLGGQVPG